jgi:hypothetical protein
VEYRPGFESCADCGAALVDQLAEPIAHPAPGHEADVAVIRAPSRPLAEMWAELLGQNGIACRLVPLSTSGSIYAPADEPFEVRVPAISAARARTILPPPGRA